jgi:hypothetical protein
MKSTVVKRVAWVFVVAAGVLTLPGLVVRPSVGVDPSWELGLHMARDRGFVVGRDIVFNYGPWGFLNQPLTLTPALWLAAVAYRVLAQLALFSALGLWMQRRLEGWTALLASAPLILFSPSPEYRWLLALGLWLALHLTARRERPLLGALLGLVAAATLLVKFSMGLAALLMVGGGILAAWWIGRRRSMLSLAAGFGGGVLLWGLVALGSFGALIGFLSASMEISTGYAAALERRGPLWQPLLVLVSFLLVTEGLLRDRKLLRAEMLALVLPFVGLLLITFKHAFVRHETHAFLAFIVGGIALSWIALAAAGRGRRTARVARACGALALAAGALWVVPPKHIPRLPVALGEHVGQALRVAQEFRRPDHRSRLREELRAQLPLPDQARKLLGDHTVDILTIEVAMAEAWDLNWRPRRVLQSYAVATGKLDAMDAAFFAGPSAPERLLVDLQGLDTRHPFMDAPRTWRQILSRYRPLGRDPRWLILGLREHPRTAVETRLHSIRLPLNQLATVPTPTDGHLEMQVRLEPSLLGRLVALPWKLPEIRLGLISSDARPPRRILAATADRPFPLTRQWPETPEDLGRLFDEQAPSAPPGIAFFTAGPWAWREAQVDFVQVVWREGSESTD